MADVGPARDEPRSPRQACRAPRGRSRVIGLARCSLACIRIVALLALVEVLVRVRPLPEVATFMGVPLASGETAEWHGADRPTLTDRDRRILRAVDRLSARWPFCEGPCLREALVSGHLLRHLHPALRVGVSAPSPSTGAGGYADRLEAHAWVEVGGFCLKGPLGFVPLLEGN